MWWVIALSVVGCLVFLVLMARRNEAGFKRDWEMLLTPKGERVYQSLEGRVRGELALAEIAYDEAFEVRELGSVDEAIRLLDVGYRVIEKFSPNMLRLLQAMATFSRMVSAMAPVQPPASSAATVVRSPRSHSTSSSLSIRCSRSVRSAGWPGTGLPTAR